MGANIITAHPRPFRTSLKNYKEVREEILFSFSPAQQDFLRRHKWKFYAVAGRKVKIDLNYHFSGAEGTYFRLLFNDYKIFNYCSRSSFDTSAYFA